MTKQNFLFLALVLALFVPGLSPASMEKPFNPSLRLSLSQAQSNQPHKMFNLHFNVTGNPANPANLAAAVAAAEPKGLEINKEYWKDFASDIKHSVIAPFHWKKKDWFTVAAVTGISAALYVNDRKIMSWVQKHRTPTTNKIAKFAERFGEVAVVFPGLALVYGYSALSKDQKAKDVALLSFKSILISELVVTALKLITHRRRPSDGEYNQWKGPKISLANLSFPSGHSAMAFSLAVVISSRYKSPVVGVLAYGTAALTALSRVHDKRHWASDVFIGSVIGYFVTRGIVKRWKKKNQNQADNASIRNHMGLSMNLAAPMGTFKGIRVFPLIGFDRLGLSMNIAF